MVIISMLIDSFVQCMLILLFIVGSFENFIFFARLGEWYSIIGTIPGQVCERRHPYHGGVSCFLKFPFSWIAVCASFYSFPPRQTLQVAS